MSPQIVGTLLIDPPTWNVSVQVPIELPVVDGWAMEKDAKCKLGDIKIYKLFVGSKKRLSCSLPNLADRFLLFHKSGI